MQGYKVAFNPIMFSSVITKLSEENSLKNRKLSMILRWWHVLRETESIIKTRGEALHKYAGGYLLQNKLCIDMKNYTIIFCLRWYQSKLVSI